MLLRATSAGFLFASFVHNLRLVRRPLAPAAFPSSDRADSFFWLCLADLAASLAGFLIIAGLWSRFRWNKGAFMLIVTQVMIGTGATQLTKFAFLRSFPQLWYATWLSLWLKGGALLCARFANTQIRFQ